MYNSQYDSINGQSFHATDNSLENSNYTSWNSFLQSNINKYSNGLYSRGGQEDEDNDKRPIACVTNVDSLNEFYDQIVKHNLTSRHPVKLNTNMLSLAKVNEYKYTIVGDAFDFNKYFENKQMPDKTNLTIDCLSNSKLKSVVARNCCNIKTIDLCNAIELNKLHLDKLDSLETITIGPIERINSDSVDSRVLATNWHVRDICIHDCKNLLNLLVPYVSHLDNLHLSYSNITTIELPRLKAVSSMCLEYLDKFNFEQNNLVSFPVLEWADSICIKNNKSMTSVNLSIVKSRKLHISNNNSLYTVTLDELDECLTIKICNNPELVLITLPKLKSVCKLKIENCPKLETIQLHNLKCINKKLNVNGCQSLEFPTKLLNIKYAKEIEMRGLKSNDNTLPLQFNGHVLKYTISDQNTTNTNE
jgi:hypothetical protein